MDLMDYFNQTNDIFVDILYQITKRNDICRYIKRWLLRVSSSSLCSSKNYAYSLDSIVWGGGWGCCVIRCASSTTLMQL